MLSRNNYCLRRSRWAKPRQFYFTSGKCGRSNRIDHHSLLFAISPDTYLKGLVRLVPPESRTRTTEVLHSIGTALKAWLLAKIVAMLAVGVLTAAGLWLLGIELALSLAILAAFLTFIPNIGPILALVPAALLAMMHVGR
jgi:predicted PurR-regulated permease PerM